MFSKITNALKSLFTTAAGLAPLASLFGPKIGTQVSTGLAMGTQMMPALLSLIGLAENLFGDGNGEMKKTFVTTTVNSMVDTMAQISTGEQKVTWETLKGADLGAAIDLIVAIVNAVKGCSEK
jgi:hypothetical protein